MDKKRFTGYLDIEGKMLCVGMICVDEANKVADIEIVEEDGVFYASPTGLDAELLSEVHNGLKIRSSSRFVEVEDVEIGKRYSECMGGIVEKDKDGILWVHDGYQKWDLSGFINERQEEILSSLIEIEGADELGGK
jgi:hypothetical protein